MKKTLLALILFTMSLNASELLGYNVSMDIKPTKANGKSWDVSGGAPDIYMRVDGKKIAFKKECRDSYRCENLSFVSNKKKFYIEVYDKDIASDDLIGKGECRAGSACTLGSAVLRIDTGRAAAIVLADARGDTRGLKEGVSELLVNVATQLQQKQQVKEDQIERLITKIGLLRTYGGDLSTKEKHLLQYIVEGIKKDRSISEDLVRRLDEIVHTSQATVA